MGRLNNAQREIFSHKVVKYKGDAVKAYKETYDTSTYASEKNIKAAATNMFYSADVKARINEVMSLVYNEDILREEIESFRKAEKAVTFEGKVTDTFPDYAVRLEMLKLYLKTVGAVSSGDQTNIQFNVASIDPQELLKIAHEVNDLSQRLSHGTQTGSVSPEKPSEA